MHVPIFITKHVHVHHQHAVFEFDHFFIRLIKELEEVHFC